MKHATALVLLFALMVVSGGAWADSDAYHPLEGEMTRSMGQPSRWFPYIGALANWNNQPESSGAGVTVHVGAEYALKAPVIKFLGANFEGYIGAIDSDLDTGGRLTAGLDPFGLRLGVDYSSRSEEVDFILTGIFHLRRGGLFGGGSRLRGDWIPGRNQSFNLGVEVPFAQPYVGKTRPRKDQVDLPRPASQANDSFVPSRELTQALDEFATAAGWVNRLSAIYTDHDGNSDEDAEAEYVDYLGELRAHLMGNDDSAPRTVEMDVSDYHARLAEAFDLALRSVPQATVEPGQGSLVAAEARRVLFDEVLTPYNRLLGQVKSPDSLLGLGSKAERRFEQWCLAAGVVSPRSKRPVMYVFRAVVEIWERWRQESLDLWDDSRLVWLPIRWTHEPSEIDSQVEMDAVCGAMLEEPFTTGNRLAWIKNEMFQGVLGRMIRETQDYHVLWIHDIRGVNDDGNPDAIAYIQTTQSYLMALIEAAEAFDQVGKMPRYFIFLDQWYYSANDAKLWMDLLEDPMHAKLKLPEGYEKWSLDIATLQDRLRQAVANSKGLQRGAERFGSRWLGNRIKVQVNITNPADYSFRSSHIIGLPLIPDALMRDHRKLAFHDVNELDPSLGSGIYTGMGVGEHYTGRTWDDRGILVQGPALVGLKTAARDLLLSQGFKEQEIPLPLRALPKAHNHEEQVAQLEANGWDGRALQVQNSTGFASKDATVMKTLIYDLMPPGGTLYVPDSLWSNSLWAGMLAGAALRGCTSLAVSPSVDNAPSAAAPTMARSHRVMMRIFLAQKHLADPIAAVDGDLRVGIYDSDIDVGDIKSQVIALKESFDRSEFLRKTFPFDPEALSVETVDEFFDSVNLDLEHLPGGLAGQKPKLHLKSQMFRSAPAEVWQDLIRRTEGHYATYMATRAQQVSDPWSADPWTSFLNAKAGQEYLTDWANTLDPEVRESLAMYLTEGTQNQDYRSMMMDGEALMVVSGRSALIALYDFFYIMGISTWVEDAEQLDSMLPAQGGFGTWAGGLIKDAI